MTSRGPFRPKTFYDSKITDKQYKKKTTNNKFECKVSGIISISEELQYLLA